MKLQQNFKYEMSQMTQPLKQMKHSSLSSADIDNEGTILWQEVV